MIRKLLPLFGYGLSGKKKTMLCIKFAKQTSMRTEYKELEDFSALNQTRLNNRKRKNVSSEEDR